LESYAAAHFKLEESCMDEHKCLVALENKEQHQTFFKKIEDFKKEYQSGGGRIN